MVASIVNGPMHPVSPDGEHVHYVAPPLASLECWNAIAILQVDGQGAVLLNPKHGRRAQPLESLASRPCGWHGGPATYNANGGHGKGLLAMLV